MSTTTVDTAECLHGIADPRWCSLCRKAAGYLPGTDRHTSDCTVIAVTHLTGATYPEAVDLLADAGRQPGRGVRDEVVIAAVRAVGWTVTPSGLDLDTAVRSGRSFLVAARKGRRGHAMAIVAGRLHNAGGWTAGIRYRLWEVS
jgi:hypothetical protein